MAVDAISGWHNSRIPGDVNADGHVTPIDALAIVNELHVHGSHRLAGVGDAAQVAGWPSSAMTPAVASDNHPSAFVDVNNDGMVSPLDLLQVFNHLDEQAAEPIAKVRLAVTDVTGAEITTIVRGQQFQLRVFVQDLRTDVADVSKGIFSAYADVAYQSTLASPSGTVTFDPLFDASQKSDTSIPGLLNEFGAARTSDITPGPAEQMLLIQNFNALQPGNLTFTAAAATDPEDDLFVYGQAEAIPSNQIQYGSAALLIIEPDPTLSINDPSAVTEGNATLTFNVTLSDTPSSTITVHYATVSGTATGGSTVNTAGADFVTQTGTLTFSPDPYDSTTRTITVDIIGDTLNEDTETFGVTLSSESSVTIIKASGIGTIIDDDAAPILSIVQPDPIIEGDSGTKPLNFIVNLSAPSGRAVTFSYAAADATAVGNVDYQPTQGTAMINPGEVSTMISVNIIGNKTHEESRVFSLGLLAPLNATLAETTTVIGAIVDDDPLPTISIADPEPITEGDSGAKQLAFSVTLSNTSGTPISVQYATVAGTASEGSDYVGTTGTLTFNSDDPLTKTITVKINGDTAVEPDENFALVLSNPDGATLANKIAGVATIQNDDLPTVGFTADPYPVNEGNTGTTPITFSVALSNASASPVTVNFSTVAGTATDGTDYVFHSGLLTFNPDDPLTKTITVYINGDTTFEPNETFSVHLSQSNGATIAAATATGTILNDDSEPAPVAVDDIANVMGNSPVVIVVLSNDDAPAGSLDPSAVQVVAPPANGHASVNHETGEISYVPNSGFVGIDTFTYQVADNHDTLSNVATVSVTVTAPPSSDVTVELKSDLPDGSVYGQPVTFTATFNTSELYSVDSGSVVVLVDGKDIGIKMAGTSTDYTATYDALELGTRLISVQYTVVSYYGSHSTATSNPITQTVSQHLLEHDPGANNDHPEQMALFVGGTPGDDLIQVGRSAVAGQYLVSVKHMDEPLKGVSIYTGTEEHVFSRIVIYGGAGNDSIQVTDSITLPTMLFGGAGDDPFIKGGSGPNILVGGRGVDKLISSQGHNLLIGGDGGDILETTRGTGDLLVRGATNFDANAAALIALLDEWKDPTGITTRINHLTGTTPGGKNGRNFLDAETVRSHDASDMTPGINALDWDFPR